MHGYIRYNKYVYNSTQNFYFVAMSLAYYMSSSTCNIKSIRILRNKCLEIT
jgi:hypothetical protein